MLIEKAKLQIKIKYSTVNRVVKCLKSKFIICMKLLTVCFNLVVQLVPLVQIESNVLWLVLQDPPKNLIDNSHYSIHSFCSTNWYSYSFSCFVHCFHSTRRLFLPLLYIWNPTQLLVTHSKSQNIWLVLCGSFKRTNLKVTAISLKLS